MQRSRGGNGPGPTGGGLGSGLRPEAPEGPTDREQKQLTGANHQGRIIGSFLVNGVPPKGEAAHEFRSVLLSGSRAAEEAMDHERIPADLKEIPLRYFEELQGDE